MRKYIPNYDKTERFLKKDKWIEILMKRQETAIASGKSLKKGKGSYSNIYKAIEVLEKTL